MIRIKKTIVGFIAGTLFLQPWHTQQAQAQESKVIVIEHAEYLISEQNTPPHDDENWKEINLPDNWALSRSEFSGQIWYRFHFKIDGSNPRSRAIYIPRNTADHYLIYINGIPRGGSRAYTDPNLTDLHRPLIHGTAGLPPGDNTIHIRIRGNAKYRHGLSRITVGPPQILRPQFYQPRYDLQVTSIAAFAATLLLAGLLALLAWSGERHNPVLMWFGIVALTWALCAYLMIWPPHLESDSSKHLLLYAARHLYTVPLFILCLRIGNTKNIYLEILLWLLIGAGLVIASLLSIDNYQTFAALSWFLYLSLGLGFLVWLLWRRFQAQNYQRGTQNTDAMYFRNSERTAHFIPFALAMVVGFTTHDWMRWMGYADFDNLLLAPFAMPFVILALGATIIAHYLESVKALARSNNELEQRVATKVSELQQVHQQIQATERQQAVMKERQRLMNDMHDGLSANLVSLYNMVQSENSNATEVARRIDDTLQELRAIVDSLEPVEGDLGVVLGHIRYRMRAAFEESGIKLRWRVDELPIIPNLNPEKILNLQRIVLETLTNTLRHADANTVTVTAREIKDRQVIQIIISDDGKGFDINTAATGRGLRNMRERAARIGILFDIQSNEQQGTSISLELPSI